MMRLVHQHSQFVVQTLRNTSLCIHTLFQHTSQSGLVHRQELFSSVGWQLPCCVFVQLTCLLSAAPLQG